MPVKRHSSGTITFASSAGSAVIRGANGLIRDVFLDYGTLDAAVTLTIKDDANKDILNGAGGTGVSADTLYTQADMGGTGNGAGDLTVALAGSVTDGKTCVVYVTVVS